jgi:hypothetical protein
MYIEEGEALDALVERFGPGSVSRRDPGDEGPLVFKPKAGGVYEIDGNQVTVVKEPGDG